MAAVDVATAVSCAPSGGADNENNWALSDSDGDPSDVALEEQVQLSSSSCATSGSSSNGSGSEDEVTEEGQLPLSSSSSSSCASRSELECEVSASEAACTTGTGIGCGTVAGAARPTGDATGPGTGATTGDSYSDQFDLCWRIESCESDQHWVQKAVAKAGPPRSRSRSPHQQQDRSSQPDVHSPQPAARSPKLAAHRVLPPQLPKPKRWPSGTGWWAERLFSILTTVASQFPFLLARPKRDILLELQCAGTAGELLGPEARLCNFEFWNAFTVEGCNFEFWNAFTVKSLCGCGTSK